MRKLRFFVLSLLCVFLLISTKIYSQDYEWMQAFEKAPWCPRDSGGEVVFDNKMWILGGWTIDANQKFQRLNDIWRSSDGVSWEKVTDSAPWPVRNLPGSVVFRNAIWILGGTDGKKAMNDVWSTADGKIWTQSPVQPPWSPRVAFGCAVYKEKLWVMGGFDTASMTHFNDVWCSKDGSNWKLISSKAAWSVRGMFPLVVFGKKMWLYGGGVYDQKSENFHDVWCTEDGAKWVRVTEDAGWAERRFHIITEYRNKLWLFGGVIDGNVNLNDIWNSTDGVSWQIVDKSAPWGVRHEQMCLVFNEKLWMFGGFGGDKAGEKLYGDGWFLTSK
jgi:hypothetical protein